MDSEMDSEMRREMDREMHKQKCINRMLMDERCAEEIQKAQIGRTIFQQNRLFTNRWRRTRRSYIKRRARDCDEVFSIWTTSSKRPVAG